MPDSLLPSSFSGPEMDPDKVADSMLSAIQVLPRLMDEYITEGTPEAWIPVSRWLLREGAGSPEERWGVLETVSTVTMIVVSGIGGVDNRYLPACEADLMALRVDEETTAGMMDAYGLITSGSGPEDELDDSWLLYADTERCNAYRFAAAVGALLAVTSAVIAEAAYHGKIHPVDLWREVLPLQPAA